MRVAVQVICRRVGGWWVPAWLGLIGLGSITGLLSGARNHQIVPGDLIKFSRGGLLIVESHWSEVYSSDWTQGGPFELLASFLMLPGSHQRTPQYVFAWDEMGWLRALLGAALTAAVLFGVRALRRDAGLRRSEAAEVAAAAVFILLQGPAALWSNGHTAQLAIAATWIWAAALARRDRTLAAGLVIGLSAGWEPWGILGLAILFIGRDRRRLAASGLICGTAATACYLPFALTGSFRMFEHRWPVAPVTMVHALWPDLTGFDWSMRAGQAAVAVLVGLLAVAAFRGSRDVVWVVPMAAGLGRLLFDPLNLTYYWFPVVVAVTVGFGMLTRAAWPGGVLFLSVSAYFAQGAGWTDGYLAEPRLAGALSVGVPVLALVSLVLARVFGEGPGRERRVRRFAGSPWPARLVDARD